MDHPPYFETTNLNPHRSVDFEEETDRAHAEKPQPSRKTQPKRRRGKDVAVKRIVKYLSVCSSPTAYHHVLKDAPDEVVKAICNAALNVEQGDIRLTPEQIRLFSTHRAKIAKLTSHDHNLGTKRQIISSQKGGFPFIPILIGTALGALGGKLFGG
jgi:hypothetical protein